MKTILNKQYKNLYVDFEYSKLNYENFLKQYWISVKFSKLLHPEIKKKDNFLKERYLSAADFTSFRAYLKEEKTQLDKYIDFVDSNNKQDLEISNEIDHLQKQLKNEKKSNKMQMEK